jgi:predicted nucleic acid-binding protein
VILADTSVWVDHLRRGRPALAGLLEGGEVVCHPFVIGELACGNLRHRAEILALLANLDHLPVAGHEEVMTLVEHRGLMGSGIGWVDAHLLAAAALAGTRLWTLDRRLASVARRLRLAAEP